MTISTTDDCPSISVVVACLNVAEVLPRCLDSIASQSFPRYEIVVADGGSIDGTHAVLKRYSGVFGDKLRWHAEPDSGIGNAWNKAIGRVRGDWILFLGADDTLAGPEVLSTVAAKLAATDRRIVYGDVRLTDHDGREVGLLADPWLAEEFRGCLKSLAHQGVFHRRSLFAAHGPFDESLRMTSDYDFLLRELTTAEPLYLPGVVVSNMQIGGLSSTRKNAHRLILEQIRLFRRHVGGIPIVLSWWLVKSLGITLLFRLGGDRFALRVSNLYRRLVGGRTPLKY